MSSAETPQERMEETLIEPFPPEGEVWSALLAAISSEVHEFESVLDEVDQNKFVDDADGVPLERLSSIFDIERETGEPIEEFRARMKTALRQQLTSATVPEIEEVAAVLLDADPGDLWVVEPESRTAFFQLAVDTAEVNVQIPPQVLSDILSNVSAAGVKVGVNVFIGADGVMWLVGDPTSISFQYYGLSAEQLEPISETGWDL